MKSIEHSLFSIFNNTHSQLLESKIIQDSRYEAREIIMHIKKWTLEEFFLHIKKATLSNQEIDLLQLIIKRRISGEPLAYILGNKEFFSMNFYVNRDVLIPRNDTETLVEAVLNNNNIDNCLKILDIGTGSGCIIISLLNNMKNAFGTAIDISEKAIKICKKNAIQNNVIDRLCLKCSNWLDKLEDYNKFDIIVSNPPYISLSEQKMMSLETKFEPEIALYSDNNGLLSYINIAKRITNYMKKSAQLYVEIGFNKAEPVKKIFNQYNIGCKNEYKDLSGHIRCLQLYSK